MSSQQTAAQRLASSSVSWVTGISRPKRSSRCRELLLDQLGCQLIGAGVPWNQPVYQFVKENKNGGPARIVKYGNKVPVDDAVLSTELSPRVASWMIIMIKAADIPGAATVPVILALARRKPSAGRS